MPSLEEEKEDLDDEQPKDGQLTQKEMEIEKPKKTKQSNEYVFSFFSKTGVPKVYAFALIRSMNSTSDLDKIKQLSSETKSKLVKGGIYSLLTLNARYTTTNILNSKEKTVIHRYFQKIKQEEKNLASIHRSISHFRPQIEVETVNLRSSTSL